MIRNPCRRLDTSRRAPLKSGSLCECDEGLDHRLERRGGVRFRHRGRALAREQTQAHRLSFREPVVELMEGCHDSQASSSKQPPETCFRKSDDVMARVQAVVNLPVHG